MVESEGEVTVDNFNDANIPVNIFIDRREDGKWTLNANNFMPRRNRCSQSTIDLVADTLEELQEVVKTKILPLYQAAAEKLQQMATFKVADFKKDVADLGNVPSLYYWSK